MIYTERSKPVQSRNVSSSHGIGVGGALLVLFVALKLLGYINWSWWWVLAPAWIPAAILLLICTIAITYIAVTAK